MNKIAGVLPCLLTPYDEKYDIDMEDLKNQIDYLYEVKSDGIVIGQVSEVLRLNTLERFEYVEKCVQFNADRGAVVVSTGGESTKNAIDYTQQAKDAGVDAVLLMHPTTTALDGNQIYRYFSEVIEAVDIPVMIHHAKSYAKTPLSPKNLARLVNEYGSERVLYKPESSPTPPKLSQLRDESFGKAKIFEGDGGMMLFDSYKRGIEGFIPATDIAAVSVKYWNELEKGNTDNAVQIGNALAYLMCQLLNSVDCYQSLGKHQLKRMGVIKSDRVRGPVDYTPDSETIQEVERAYDFCNSFL